MDSNFTKIFIEHIILVVGENDMSRKLLFKRKISRFIELYINKATVEWCFIFVLILIAFSIFNFLLMPQIRLNGGKKIFINYKDKYSENGFKASFMGRDLTEDVTSLRNLVSIKLFIL